MFKQSVIVKITITSKEDLGMMWLNPDNVKLSLTKPDFQLPYDEIQVEWSGRKKNQFQNKEVME